MNDIMDAFLFYIVFARMIQLGIHDWHALVSAYMYTMLIKGMLYFSYLVE